MNYLSTDHDRMVAAKGLKLTRKIVMESETFKKYKPEEYQIILKQFFIQVLI